MVHVLDTYQLGKPKIIAATAMETADGLALFDTGPESTFENIAKALENLGSKPADVRHVFLSHIHFDHAGAAWRFAASGATVYAHPRGAPHLVDPRQLVESATRIFGSDMERLWGRIEAVPRDRLRVLEDGDIVRLGDVSIKAISTPGHATHHHIYHWEDNVFGGDIAGVQIGDGPPIPPFVPPELDVEAWQVSIRKIRELQPARIYLPHFGCAQGDPDAHLAALAERVERWSKWFRDRLRAGEEQAELLSAFAQYEADDLQRGGASMDDVAAYEAADPSSMAVTAALRYWRKQHPEEIISRAAPDGLSD